MLELADRLLPLLAAGSRVAVATSIDVIGSSPHAVGTSMAVTAAGDVLGSVSGGCVEDAALRDCRALLAGAAPAVRRFGFGDGEAARAGLACGGELDVLVHELDPVLLEVLQRAAAGEPAVVAFVTGGPERLVGRACTEATVDVLAAEVPGLRPGLLRAALDGRRELGVSGPAEVACAGTTLRLLVDVAAPRRRMVIGGGTETAAALAAAATAIGYLVTVCDPRAVFLAPERFPGTTVAVARTHDVIGRAGLTARDAVCLLGHDDDLDPLALAVALEGEAGYVGALGSRSTASRRRERLLALGASEAALARLRMPIGLDVGARTPQELAVSILAEVLSVRSGREAAPLRAGEGPIHGAVPAR